MPTSDQSARRYGARYNYPLVLSTYNRVLLYVLEFQTGSHSAADIEAFLLPVDETVEVNLVSIRI